MSVSGLVITLSEDPVERACAFERLRGRSDLQFGELSDRWLPVVMEKSDNESAEAVFREISLLRGVEYVDVVFVQFEDGERMTGLSDSREIDGSIQTCSGRTAISGQTIFYESA